MTVNPLSGVSLVTTQELSMLRRKLMDRDLIDDTIKFERLACVWVSGCYIVGIAWGVLTRIMLLASSIPVILYAYRISRDFSSRQVCGHALNFQVRTRDSSIDCLACIDWHIFWKLTRRVYLYFIFVNHILGGGEKCNLTLIAFNLERCKRLIPSSLCATYVMSGMQILFGRKLQTLMV